MARYKRKRKSTSPWVNKKKRVRKGLMRSGGWLLNTRRRTTNTELKWIDAPVNSTHRMNYGNDLNECRVFLNGIAQGTGASDRIGLKLTMKSIYLRLRPFLNIDQNIGNGIVGETFRVIIVYDRQSNGAAPVVADVINVDTTPGYGVLNAAMNLYNKDRFQIIHDKMHKIQLGCEPTATTPVITNGMFTATIRQNFGHIEIFEKLNHSVQYNSATGLIADVRTGGLFCFLLADYPKAESPVCFTANFRLRYIDP